MQNSVLHAQDVDALTSTSTTSTVTFDTSALSHACFPAVCAPIKLTISSVCWVTWHWYTASQPSCNLQVHAVTPVSLQSVILQIQLKAVFAQWYLVSTSAHSLASSLTDCLIQGQLGNKLSDEYINHRLKFDCVHKV